MAATPETQDTQPDRLPVDETEKLLRAIFGTAGVGAVTPSGVGTGPVEGRLSGVESRLGQVETRLNQVDSRLGQVETRLAVVETKLGGVEAGQTRVETATLRLQENARTDFRLVFGALIATALGLAGMMAKGFHWI